MMTLLRSLERHQRSLRNRIALWPGLPGAPDILDLSASRAAGSS